MKPSKFIPILKGYFISAEHLNTLQISSIEKHRKIFNSAKLIDFRARKDSVEYWREADYMKYLEPVYEYLTTQPTEVNNKNGKRS